MNPRLACIPTAFALLVASCGSKPPTVAAPTANEVRATQERDAAIAQAKQAAAEQELAQAALRAQTEQVAKLGAQVALLQEQLAAQQQAARIKPPTRLAPDRAATYGVPVGDGIVVGSPTALVTLIRAYEYACPYSQKSRETMEQLQIKYGSSLRIVYKPLIVHPLLATAPALAACAANQQGKFVQMDNLIWEDIFKARNFDPEWTNPDDSKEPCWDHGHCDNLNALAQKLRLNLPQFKRDMKGVCQKQLQSEMASLQSFGVTATPGFFINGRFLSGAQPIENFSALIDEELAKAVAATQR
ncbi:MAG TPA: thioredoxin domain-containing protein, partial [Kofleriaceae bacterium]|nr:thioredoxin domain-containing protein [Kofleriaceae bacterium]